MPTAMLALWLGVAAALPAHAGERNAVRASASSPTPTARHERAVETERSEPGAIARLSERLRSIPLRPVSIGTKPRRPTDPETGVGVVFKVRF